MASQPIHRHGNGPSDAGATAEILPVVYDELRRLASRFLQRERPDHTLQPTALVHEAYLRLTQQDQAVWKNPEQFFCVAATSMRRILVNHAKRRLAVRHGGGRKIIGFDDDSFAHRQPNSMLLALDDAIAALAEIDPRKARIVELRYFAGFQIEEVARLLKISVTTVKREWAFAKAWLLREMSESNGS